jgi:hypothetical protein
MYRDEYVAGFERGGSRLRMNVTTEYMKQGNAVVFLVADSGSATAVTRGSDGLYPARVNNNNQTTLTLADATDLPRMNGFDIFRSQGAQREIMYKTSQDVISRSVDAIAISDCLSEILCSSSFSLSISLLLNFYFLSSLFVFFRQFFFQILVFPSFRAHSPYFIHPRVHHAKNLAMAAPSRRCAASIPALSQAFFRLLASARGELPLPPAPCIWR